MNFFFCLVFLFLSIPSLAIEPAGKNTNKDPLTAGAKEAIAEKDLVRAAVEMQPVAKDGVFRSWFPIAGYNPTYRVFAGGGYFRRRVVEGKVKSEWSIMGILSQEKAVKLELRTDIALGGRWRFVMRNELANGFESNFGLGNDTKTADRVDIDLWKNEIDAYIPYEINPRLRIGPYLESRVRRNHPMSSAELGRQKDPVTDREFTIALGFKQELDFRNVPDNPSLGWQQIFRAFTGFPYQGVSRKPFTTVDAEIRAFQYLVANELVAAYSLSGGFIDGNPPFLSQFRLGGTDKLRGFYYNRFRGARFYLQQNELRFPIWKLFSGVAFLEFGEATEKHFTRANVSYGMGLRIGLPPDNVAKVRIDYALSRDQKGIFVDFGQAF